MNHKHLKIISASLLAVLLLSACGDSNNQRGGAASGDAFVNTVQQIANTTPEDTDASNVDALSVTLPEDSEPLNVS